MYTGELVRLRALEMSDLDDILKFYNTLELRRFLGPPIVRSRRCMEQWLQKVSIWSPWRDGHLYLAVEEKGTKEFLGVARIEDLRLPHNRGEVGISIYNPEKRGKGYGTDAMLVLLGVGFEILGLNSIYLDTMEDNKRSIEVYEKIGFKRVGLLRETEYMDGAHKDLLIMDILRKEFIEKYPDGTFKDSQ
ncbi:MAG: Spermidine N(1)-acetyltransferase [Candidatus Thorarchaeota archaeon AB_25]|nr:MAG: Spermidine N(1)-acetyltransferase [Candidatus Thorarchaeota archaeon AB_25]